MILPVLLLLAQSPALPLPMQRAIERGLKPVATVQQMNLRGKPASETTCSVPLVEMKIPEDATYSMKMVKPESNSAPMPAVQLPAPPCSAKSR